MKLGEVTSQIQSFLWPVINWASLSESHTSMVNSEFLCIIGGGGCGRLCGGDWWAVVCTSTLYSGFLRLVPMLQVGVLILRILTSHSQYATGRARG